MYYCTNAACPAQVQARIELFASRGAMDIRGIGESMSATLLSAGLVKDVADLYYLKMEDLLGVDRMGEKSAGNVIKAIQDSRSRPLDRLIYALGIRHVGAEISSVLARHFADLDDLASAEEPRLTDVAGIGPKIARSISAFFRQEENRHIVEKLRKAGVWPGRAMDTAGLPLKGLEFVVTGALRAFSRDVAHDRIRALGGMVKDNVTRQTTYLVVGVDPGVAKIARGEVLGTRRIDETEFLRLLGEKEDRALAGPGGVD